MNKTLGLQITDVKNSYVFLYRSFASQLITKYEFYVLDDRVLFYMCTICVTPKKRQVESYKKRIITSRYKRRCTMGTKPNYTVACTSLCECVLQMHVIFIHKIITMVSEKVSVFSITKSFYVCQMVPVSIFLGEFKHPYVRLHPLISRTQNLTIQNACLTHKRNKQNKIKSQKAHQCNKLIIIMTPSEVRTHTRTHALQ